MTALSVLEIVDSLIDILGAVLELDRSDVSEAAAIRELGVTSLHAIELLEAINARFDLGEPTSVVFEFNTIGELARHLAKALASRAAASREQEEDDEPATAAVNHESLSGIRVGLGPGDATRVAGTTRAGGIDIAIIGLACRCAGANDTESFWSLISEGRVCTRAIEREDWREYFLAQGVSGASIRYGAMSGVEYFDPLFFNISPKEAAAMDVSHRILLEESYKALEDAGYAPGLLRGARVGTYVGAFGSSVPVPPDHSHYSMLGSDTSILASRLAYHLDLKGPSLAINTSCSSSLVALDLGCRALRNREIDLALAGGITIWGHPHPFISMSHAGMLSPTGQCRPFDSRADGILVGDGVGVLILKRLEDAERDRDSIYGVVRGIGTNQDGQTAGITVPSFLAQSALQSEIYERAGINVADVQYIEAHGTATRLGDPVEVHALTESFGKLTSKKAFCAIGSVKANIGHTGAAAGVMGVIKVLLSLRHRRLPPAVNFTLENPHIGFAHSPVYVNTALQEWVENAAGSRLAAVSSFGYSGTNAHVVLEDPGARVQTSASDDARQAPAAVLVPLSARTQIALRTNIERLHGLLSSSDPSAAIGSNDALAAIAFSLQVGRDAMEHRLAVVVSSLPELRERLRAVLNEERQIPGCWSGHVERGSHSDLLLGGDDDSRELIHNWTVKRRLATLARLWTSGASIDWTALYGGRHPRRIHLPTYAFAREPFALPTCVVERPPASRRPGVIHPLLHRNTSDVLEQRFTSSFTGREPVFADHVIHGRRILPGVAYLEMARVAVAQGAAIPMQSAASIRLRNVVWTCPLAVDEPAADANGVDVHVGLFPDESGRIEFDVYTQRGDRAERVSHCTGVASCGDSPERATADIDELRARMREGSVGRDDLYAGFQAAGITYGPSHRAVEVIYVGDGQVLARLSVPASQMPHPLDAPEVPFVLHPSVMDAALQASIALRPKSGDRSSQRAALPFTLRELSIHGACAATMWAWARLSSEGVADTNGKTVDIDLLDDAGHVCVRLQGLGSRVIDADVLPASRPDRAPQMLHPLVHHDCSTPNRRVFMSTFDGSEFFLDDHRVDGLKVLPGAAYVEMVRVAGSRLGGGDVVGLKNIVWTQPIRVEDAPAHVVIRFDADAGSGSYQVCTGSDALGSGGTVHCQGNVLLNQVRSEGPPEVIDIRAIEARCTVRKEHEAVADDLTRVFGDHGTRRSFQAAVHLACNEDEALVTLELPECVRDGSSAYLLHPSMINGAFEAALLWSMVRSRDLTMQLPFAIEQLWIHGPLPSRAYAYVRRARGAHRGANSASYDIDLADRDGAVALSLVGYSTMPASSSRRNALMYAVPRWRERPLTSDVARTPTEEPMFILAPDAAALRAELARQWPQARIEALSADGADEIDPAEHACSSLLQAFRLIQSCVKTPARAGQPILALIPESEDAYLHGALNGLMRTAIRECPRIAGKIVRFEVTSASAPDLVAFLRAELDSGDAEVEIRRARDGSRTVKRLEEVDRHLETAIPEPARDDVLWITGGLGGLGRILAEHVAARCGSLVLSGRSTLSSSGREFIADLERRGVVAEYQQCDVSDERQVARLVSRVVGRYGRLTGIIHNAGVIEDALIVNKTEQQIRRVLAPKVIGTLAIHRATEEIDLALFVLASSYGALFGNAGQADYSAANSFLDAFAEHRNRLAAEGRCHGRTISINWPLWRSGGMSVTREAELLMERATGMVAMDTERGLQAFDLVLRSGRSGPSGQSEYDQLLVAQGDAERIRNTLLGDRHGRRLGSPAASRATVAQPVPSPDATIVDATLVEEIHRGLVAAVSELQHVEAARIDLDTPLSRYGFDSIGFTELANVLNRRYGFEEMPTVFFEHSDLRSVTRHLVERYRDLIRQRMDRSGGRAADERRPPVEPRTRVRTRQTARPPRVPREPSSARAGRIAIIGVGAKLPGAKDLDEFWRHLEANRDLITEVPAGRWDRPDGRPAPDVSVERRPITAGGFLSGVDLFDPSFFKISPREAEQMDPQLRLLLETVWATIEDAGYRASELSGRRVGVFAGVGVGGYRELWEQSAPGYGIQGAVGLYPFMVANRISYALNLHGPSEVIDTACSSSLVALHRAVESLRGGSCEMALVGGANIMSSPSITLDASEAGVLSPDGRCKTFAKHADGYGRGEAVVAVLLKPLDQAREAGDRIHAVIRGSAENHGGRATSPTAPNPAAQQALLVDAYTTADVDPRTVTYIEAHGTGTELGDPIEVKGLKGAFAELYRRFGYATGDKPHCGLGSVKTNIGHSEAVSGLCGVIKVLLMLQHRKIPGNVHLVEENPYLQLEGSPFYLVRATRDWPAMTDAGERALPRRAGVSSFGVGGTNVHVILEEYVHPEERAPVFSNQPHLVVLSARNEDRLREHARNLLFVVDADSRDHHGSSPGDGAAPSSPAAIEAEIRRLVAAALDVPESDLDLHEPFEQYGVDRALRVLLLEQIANSLDVETRTAEISCDESIASVARTLTRTRSQVPRRDAEPGDRTRADREERGLNLRNLAFTLQVGREPMDERLGLIVRSPRELRACLNAFLQGRELPGVFRGRVAAKSDTGQLTADAHEADALNDAIVHGRHAEILSLWVKGANVDWSELYAGTTKPRPINAPTYPFARERYWISGSGGAPTRRDRWDGVSYVATWEEAPASVASTPRREHRATLIVYSEPSFGFEEAIASHYRHIQPNAVVIRVQLGNETRQLAEHRYVCGVDDPEGFDRCLGDRPRIDCVFFVPAFREPTAFRFGGDLASSQEWNEIQWLRLTKCLQRRTMPDSVVDCFLVTQDNHGAFGRSTSPYGGGLTGLAHAAAQGDHRLRLRHVDVSFGDLETAASREKLLTMLLLEAPSDRGEVTKFQSGHRYERRFQRLAWPESNQPSGIRRGGVYVVVGGSGTVGRIVTRRLMRDHEADVVWIGRRAIDDADGDRPSLYVQADATDLASMTRALDAIKQRYETVNGAIFSAVIFEDRNSVRETSEAQFRRILDVKTRGLINFYAVFEDEPLDFLCSFSSAQSYAFSGAAKLAAYATGIAFADCFLDSVRARARFPVGIVNWGFWKRSLDGVSVHDDIGSLEDEEGFRCFERFVSALRQRVLGQVLCLKASESVSRLMRVQSDQIAVCPEAGPASAMRQLMRGRGWRSEASRIPTTERGSEELNGWFRDLLFDQLLRLGAFSGEAKEDGAIFGPNAGLSDRLERWWHESLTILAKHGYIQRTNAGLVARRNGKASDPWDGWAARKKTYVANPEMRDGVELVDRCLRRLPEVLRGELPATEVLFPRSSLDGVKSVYTRDAVADYFNKTLAAVAAAYVDARIGDEPGSRLRILEIGAGTGATTASVLERLTAHESHIAEYRYTDLSKAFLLHGQEHYGSTPYLRFDRADIDEPLTGQGIAPGAYDVVIAGNVLHASRNVRSALWNIKSALRRHGILLLNELVETSLFAHLTFGLLDGWWHYEDAALRIPGSPILSLETWRRVLEEAGFVSVLSPAKAASALGQQIIVAESDGFRTRTAVPDACGVERTHAGGAPARSQRRRAPVSEARHAASPDAASRELVSRVIRESLCRALKIAADNLDPSVQFSDLGMDSLIGVGFVDEISDRLGIRLNRAIIFDYSTVERLTRYVIETFGEGIAAEASAPPEIAAEASPPVHSGPAAAAVSVSIPSEVVRRTPPSVHPAGSSSGRGDIAVVGMSGQFPGATDVAAFWANLEQGTDGVGELPPRYLSTARSGAEGSSAAGYRWGGVLENRDCFDPLFFNISPREALSMNPHQRLVLQESWRAIEDAGYNPRALASSPVGVFIGAEPSGYAHESFTGASDAIIASRLSYFLDLKGPALVVNTGCSSSAVAIHLACQSLRQMESSACLAGGVFVSSGQYGAVTPAEMLSPTGRCRAFDDRADGTVFSEGVGIVMLKRLADAVSDGDAIHGVILASGINQDGASNGITAPNGLAQEALIVDVYRRHGISADDISYVEAHGTGTKLGDPVEGNALVRAFTQFTARRQYCAIGSAKAHIGHTGASAGVAGLIKLLLALKHRRIPGLLHFEKLNSSIELEESPFLISNRAAPWTPSDGRRRVAALNSFGHGGTNAHIVVAEYAAGEQVGREENRGPHLILLSARSRERLGDAVTNLRDYLLQVPEIDIADLAYTLQVGRDAMNQRVALLVDDAGELRDRLNRLVEGQPTITRCWQGAAAGENKKRIRLLSSDEEMKELVARWIANGKLVTLAELWVQGLDVDWQRLYERVRRRRLHLPTYVFDMQHFWAPRPLLSRDDEPQSFAEGPASDVVPSPLQDDVPLGIVTLAPVWKRAAVPDAAPLVPGAEARTVVVGGTREQHAEIRRIYSRARALEACESKSVQQMAAELEGIEPLEQVIWLAPKTTRTMKTMRTMKTKTSAVTDESCLDAQRRGVLLIFRLVKALLSLGYGDRILSWTCVTTQAQATYPSETIDPTHAGVHGLVGSIAKEYPAWRMRLVDVPAGHDVSSLGGLFTLPFDARGNALACRNGEWLRQTLTPVRALESGPPVYRQGGVYAVIGGAGAIGEVWSRWVIERYLAHVIWIGRRPKDEAIQRKIDALSELGPSPVYIQADASDRVELQRAYEAIKRLHPRVHGVIHSAVGLFDQSLATTDESRFREIVSAKIDVTVRLAQVFGVEPLDLVLVFSSVSAFGKGGGLSGYSTGCTFADAFAHSLGTEWAGAVKVMNWGYWRIGAGALLSPTARARLEHAGLEAIEPAEGMNALDQLLYSPLNQLACVRALKPGALDDVDLAECVTVYPEAIPSAVAAIPTYLGNLDAPSEGLRAADICEDAELEQLLRDFLYATLFKLGWLRRSDAPSLTHLPGYFKRWLDESWRILESHPHSESRLELAGLWRDWERVTARWAKHVGAEPVMSLLEICLRALPDILTGKRISTDVIFPNSSLHLVSGVYQGNPVADYFNDVLAQALVAYLAARRPLDAAQGREMARVRILEVGAGTGAATGVVLRKLEPFAAQIEEYCYTDISKAFLFHAHEVYGNQPVTLTTRLLDIAVPLAEQNIEANAFDIVIATNVLHATPDVRQALRHAKAALRRNGLLLLNEIRRASVFGHLTFGLIEGWWRYEDGALRIPGCPALLPETWCQLLAEEGFRFVMLLPDSVSGPGQQVIAAESDGVVRQPAAQRRDARRVVEEGVARANPDVATDRAPASVPIGTTSGQELRERSIGYFKRLFARTLRMESALIDASEPLLAYGMDSILIVQVTDKLRDTFGELDSTLLFQKQSTNALVDYFLDAHRESLAKLVGLDESATGPRRQRQDPTAATAPVRVEVPGERFRLQRTTASPAPGPTSSFEPIAIIGVSGRYPHAENLEALWQNLESGQDCIDEIPADRWSLDAFFHPDPHEAVELGRSYSKWGGFLSDYACFDPGFFKISHLEAAAMDPQERLFLEGCWELLEDAGYTRETLRRDYGQRVGVFAGVTKNGYCLYAPELWRQGESTYPYTSFSSVANRVSYVLDLQGPSFPIDTMCSSSLTAIHEACEHLQRRECDMAIAGGVNLYLHPLAYVGLSSQQMLSPDGRCRSFGAGANGFVPGEGVGVVLLKPLARAVQDRDRIHAVIRGTSVNHGGRTGGYTVPSPIAQGQVIRVALDRAGVSADAVSYIEAHGTGTELGDPIEIQGLTSAFRKDTNRTGYCAVGSVKSNLGHLESAAGIAGLTKVILQMKQRMLVPSLYASELNPHIDFEKTPFVVQRELAEWTRPIVEIGGEARELPRIAGISSFGAGGSNAHVVIEEYIPGGKDEHGAGLPIGQTSARGATRSQVIPLSARTDDRLVEYARRLRDFLLKHQRRGEEAAAVGGEPAVELRDVAYTLQVGREAMECRLGLIVESVEELIEKLGRFLGNDREIHGLHLGKLSPGGETMSLFAADEDLAGAVDTWIGKGKYSRIVELWVKGLSFDWRKLHETAAEGQPEPRRIGLPSYPFARERYWMPVQRAGGAGATSTPTTPAALHPLVHANTSDFAGQRYVSTFTGREPFLADHVVRGERVVPAVAYVEMVRAAMSHASPASGSAARGLTLRDVVWPRPLAVGASGRRVRIALVAQADDCAAFEVCTDAARTAGQDEVYCQGTAEFRVVRKVDALDLVRLRASLNLREVSHELLYDAFAAIAIEYGASHRLVETVFVGHQQLLAKLMVPTPVKTRQVDSLDEVVLHIGLMDAALQASLALGIGDSARDVASTTAQGAGTAVRPALPFGAEEIEIPGKVGACGWAWIRYSAGSSPDDRIRKLDIDCCDDAGEIGVRIRGFSSKAIVDRAEDLSPQDATGLMMLSPVWEAVRAPANGHPSPEAGAHIVVVGGTEERRQAIRALYPDARVLDVGAAAGVEAIAKTLSAGGAFEHLVWLPPSRPLDSAVDESLIEDQHGGVLQLFRIIKALLFLGYEHRDFGATVVTEQVQSYRPDESANPTHAGVHGLVGSLAKEYPQWRIRLLDLAAGDTCSERELFAQPFDPDGDCLVHRSRQWSKQTLARVHATGSDRVAYREHGTYVVIGGAGGIGEAWTRSVLSSHKARVIWIGRRGRDAAIQAKLESLGARGPVPAYIQADASDREALERAREEIVRRHGRIHGVIHSALVLLDRSLANMDEEQFLAALRAKVDVSVRLAQVFQHDDLDFVLFFSSLTAFGKSPGQGNYAAGCTFADAFARRLAQDWPCAVKVMNWGYWGTVGVVADAANRERMRRAGIGSIEPAEGTRAVELLLRSPLDQLALVRTLRPDALGSTTSTQHLTTYPETIPCCANDFSGELPERDGTVQHLVAVEARQRSAIEELLLQIVWSSVCTHGLFLDERGSLRDLASCVKLPGLHSRWLDETIRMLEASGIVRIEAGHWTGHRAPTSLDALWDQWDRTVAGWKADPARASLVGLLEACLRALPQIARGERLATDVVFPDASLDLVEGVYKGNPVVDYFSDVLATNVVRYLEARLTRDPAADIRLIEIGAGTGGTTAGLLPRLDRFRDNIKEYCYTDISRAFLVHAEDRYAQRYPYLTTRIFDVSRPIAGQRIEADRYDLALATNVLHATVDIRWALRNAKATLRRNGLMILNEISDRSLLTHLTFGLLDGWWLHEDPELRIPGCPGLYPDVWKETLSEEGFRSVRFPAQGAHPLGQQIVVAESDGVVRQERRRSSASQRSTKEASARSVQEAVDAATAAASGASTLESLRALSVAHVKRTVASTLKMSPAEIDASRPLEEYGVDSIMVVRLTNALRKEFVGIKSTLLFEVQSIDALIEHLLRTQRETLVRLVGLDEGPVAAGTAGPGPLRGDAARPAGQPALLRRPRAAPPAMSQRVWREGGALRPQDVAVIGLSGRYPQARDVNAFMANLRAGRNCITEIPRERWHWEHYYDEKKGKEGRTYSKWGGFLDDVDKFDPLFFRISPREAERMDPQERLFLQIAYGAVEDAGYTPATLCESRRVGVFVGAMNSTYSREPSHYSIANRISYLMDFTGPSLAVDTACSSSLTAIHLALESLYSGTSDCAIAGGVSLILDPVHYVTLSEMLMISATDACKPFGDRADGFVDGEGVGAVVLKPLCNALADRDHIYGVIKGSMVNASGKTNGYTVPNPRAQTQLIHEALSRAGVKARHVSYLEAHGTGTALGDPIEIAGLTECFERDTSDKQFCAIGSVKSNIGHGESAAGIAALTKVLLQMRDGQLVPSLHAEELNREIDFAETPFFVQRDLADWKRPTCIVDREARLLPRIAGISSFGAGGANAHLVIEEFIDEAQPGEDRGLTAEPEAVVLSARDETRLSEMMGNLRQFVLDATHLNLSELAYTLQVGREAMEERVALIVSSPEDLAQKLERLLAGDNVRDVFRGHVKRHEETLAVLGADEELRGALDQWIRRRKYSALLSLWVKGLIVDWAKLHEGRRLRRVSGPTYPFARERYWAQSSQAAVSVDGNGRGANGGRDAVAPRDRSFHEHLLDRLSAHDIGVEDAIRVVRSGQ